MTNKAQIASWVKDYGEDSDFVRVRVRGVFPRAGTLQFIDGERVAGGDCARAGRADPTAPLVMGVDIARQGERPERHPLPPRPRRPLDPGGEVPHPRPDAGRQPRHGAGRAHKPDAVFVDGTGIGWGVLDRLSQLGCPNLVGVDFGGRADRTDGSDAAARYANKRAEMWGFMKDWCKAGCLPDDRDLAADLAGVDYGYDAANAILLERKEDMRRRGASLPPTTATRSRSPSPIPLRGATRPTSAASRRRSRS